MNHENVIKLVKAFPNLYSERDPLFREEDEMGFGFDVGDGWFNLLWELSEKLEAEILRLKAEGRTDESLPHVHQVKEKYGLLSFDAGGTDKMMNDIAEAENQSATICEMCGAPGKLNVDLETEPIYKWVMVRCPKHWEKDLWERDD